jgi:hypothetical protein
MQLRKKSTQVDAPIARAFERAPVDFRRSHDEGRVAIFDPDRPTLTPDDLLKEMGGMADPNAMNHKCPFCDREPMRWEIFSAHARECFLSYQALHPRNFAGASRKDS